MIDIERFHCWCIQNIPAVFTEGMTYEEQICKILQILKGQEKNLQLTKEELQEFENQVNQQFEELKNGTWIEGTIPYLEKLLKEYIPVAMFPGLTQDGYFCIYIPSTWDSIMFATSGYDTVVPCQLEYGHLVMYY